eukprot:GHRQ01032856.1.p2 GENE.GHRQ01032856.1~~GHRQ01032856.1.p2  ORF type:complete len:101 (-),score=16.01 GHRQ01032856.1:326-628(-)
MLRAASTWPMLPASRLITRSSYATACDATESDERKASGKSKVGRLPCHAGEQPLEHKLRRVLLGLQAVGGQAARQSPRPQENEAGRDFHSTLTAGDAEAA